MAIVDTPSWTSPMDALFSAKNPRKWPGLLDFRARYVVAPAARQELPLVEITLPDGTRVRSDAPMAEQSLSHALGRSVTIARVPPAGQSLEEFWPQIEGLTPIGEPVASEPGETVTALPLALLAADGGFFDLAPIHLVTTATLARLQVLHPSGRFDVCRFRPNLVIATDPAVVDFVENDWIGQVLAIGHQVQLQIIDPCPRCVMTTLPQNGLEADPAILRTIAKHNIVPSATLTPGDALQACVGVYATVLRGGIVRRGDSIRTA